MAHWCPFSPSFFANIFSPLKMRVKATKEGNGETKNVLNYASHLRIMFSRKGEIKSLEQDEKHEQLAFFYQTKSEGQCLHCHLDLLCVQVPKRDFSRCIYLLLDALWPIAAVKDRYV